MMRSVQAMYREDETYFKIMPIATSQEYLSVILWLKQRLSYVI